MNRTGHKGRVDGNHAECIKALREAGISAISLASVGDGCGDILAGFRGANFLIEVKDGDKPQTAAERDFAAEWSGHYAVVTNAEAAVGAVVNAAKALGLV